MPRNYRYLDREFVTHYTERRGFMEKGVLVTGSACIPHCFARALGVLRKGLLRA